MSDTARRVAGNAHRRGGSPGGSPGAWLSGQPGVVRPFRRRPRRIHTNPPLWDRDSAEPLLHRPSRRRWYLPTATLTAPAHRSNLGQDLLGMAVPGADGDPDATSQVRTVARSPAWGEREGSSCPFLPPPVAPGP